MRSLPPSSNFHTPERPRGTGYKGVSNCRRGCTYDTRMLQYAENNNHLNSNATFRKHSKTSTRMFAIGNNTKDSAVTRGIAQPSNSNHKFNNERTSPANTRRRTPCCSMIFAVSAMTLSPKYRNVTPNISRAQNQNKYCL